MFSKWRHRGSERLPDLPEVTQLVVGMGRLLLSQVVAQLLTDPDPAGEVFYGAHTAVKKQLFK